MEFLTLFQLKFRLYILGVEEIGLDVVNDIKHGDNITDAQTPDEPTNNQTKYSHRNLANATGTGKNSFLYLRYKALYTRKDKNYFFTFYRYCIMGSDGKNFARRGSYFRSHGVFHIHIKNLETTGMISKVDNQELIRIKVFFYTNYVHTAYISAHNSFKCSHWLL